MDFPIFFIDHAGNRLIMAITAILHVLINHPFAVGGYPVLVALEWWAHRTGDRDADALAYRIAFVFFIVTTTVGALTGVGIWLTSSLIAPFAIGSLLRVFFFAWAAEWIVFIIELVLIMVYFLTWKKWATGVKKRWHILVGVSLAFFSWVTMAIITAILGFMMDPGIWRNPGAFDEIDRLRAMFNPIYLPQLAFRTTYAMVTGGLLVWLLLPAFTPGKPELRALVARKIAVWVLVWVPLCALSVFWYWSVVPEFMHRNIDVAILGKNFSAWHRVFIALGNGMLGAVFVTALVGVFRHGRVPTVLLVIPFVLGMALLGQFERIREFIRKPYIIGGYMYANGILKTELPVLQRDGMLTYATYVKHRRVTDDNRIEAGRDVFMIACSRCHTSSGMNGLVGKFDKMYRGQWDDGAMKLFLTHMGTSHPYMPPFPGNDAEKDALIAFLRDLKVRPRTIAGAQEEGIWLPADMPSAN